MLHGTVCIVQLYDLKDVKAHKHGCQKSMLEEQTEQGSTMKTRGELGTGRGGDLGEGGGVRGGGRGLKQ